MFGTAARATAAGRALLAPAFAAALALFAVRCGTDQPTAPAPAPPSAPAPPPAPPPTPAPAPVPGTLGAATHVVPVFPDGSGDSGRQGFLRIVNYSSGAGAVEIRAFDGDGLHYGPATLTVEAGQAVHLDAEDLARGNPARGLSGATGSGWGDGGLALSTGLDIMVLSYIRHRDGFLTSMHEVAPRAGNRYLVPTFQPGSEPDRRSRLRLINTGEDPAFVRIRGIDDRGNRSREATVSLPAGATREFTAAELESGTGLNGALGRGSGRWRLALESEVELVVVSLLENPAGYLANLSSAPHPTRSGAWTVPLFPAAADPRGRRGLVRVINHAPRGGDVQITAFDDGPRRHPPFRVRIEAGHAAHLGPVDLEAALSAGGGSGGRLVVSSELDIEVLSYLEHPDGFLAPIHDVAPLDGHRVATFPASGDPDRESRLRLINPGEAAARVTVGAIGDRGGPPVHTVEVTVPAGAAREFTAADLGLRATAASDPGDGPGFWRLVIDSGERVEAMSLLESATGRLANLSTEGRRDPVPVEDHFVETPRGNPAGVAVSVVDGVGFAAGEHGQRITDIFLDRTRYASLVQIGGWGEWALHGAAVEGSNRAGYVRHAVTRGGGIFWTATDDAPLYQPGRSGWFLKHGRPLGQNAREFANWMRNRDVLFVSSLENPTCDGPPERCVTVYCDDFELDANREWIPLCGVVDDYVAHTGVGLDRALFVGALSGNEAFGAIRADGVFALHTIYVESPDGSTSQATPVLAAYATNLSFANPSWGARRLKRELLALAREETITYHVGGIASGAPVTERRTVKTIRPRFAPLRAPGR